MDDKVERILQSLQAVSVGLESVRVSLEGLVKVSADHEERLRVLESWRQTLMPICAAGTFVLGALFTSWLRLTWG